MIHIGGCRVAKNKPLGGLKVQIDTLELELWRFEAQNDEICFSRQSPPTQCDAHALFYHAQLNWVISSQGRP